MDDVKELIEKEFQNFTIKYKLDDYKKTFSNLTELKTHFQIECDFWENEDSKLLVHNKKANSSYLNRCNQLFNNATIENYKELSTTLKNELMRTPITLLLSTLHATQFLIFEAKNYPNRYQGCYSVIVDHNFGMLNQALRINDEHFDYFLGVLDGYNYLRDKTAQNGARQNSDLKVFSNYLTTITDIRDKAYAKLNTIEDEQQRVMTNVLQENENFKKIQINELDSFNLTVKKSNDNFQEIITDAEKKIESLTSLYTEKLRLEAPAKHWSNLKKEYNANGKLWKNCSIITSAIMVITMITLLYWLPEWLKSNDSSLHFKGLIIFSIIVSTLSYLIHLFTKLSTSAFHLSRDAAERYQLTHVYLSLMNEKGAIDKEDRQIILQALFSRADTGLLKHEGSPAFPDALNQLLSKVRK